MKTMSSIIWNKDDSLERQDRLMGWLKGKTHGVSSHTGGLEAISSLPNIEVPWNEIQSTEIQYIILKRLLRWMSAHRLFYLRRKEV